MVTVEFEAQSREGLIDIVNENRQRTAEAGNAEDEQEFDLDRAVQLHQRRHKQQDDQDRRQQRAPGRQGNCQADQFRAPPKNVQLCLNPSPGRFWLAG